MNLSKNEIAEYSLLAAFWVGTFALKTTHHFGFLVLFGCAILLAEMVVWIRGYKEYPLINTDGKKLVAAYIWSFYARMMLIIAGIFLKGSYPGEKIMMFVAFLASISYIIFAACKQKGREAVKMAVYFILAL